MAYAATVSLAQLLKQLLQSEPLSLHYPEPELQSLHENVSSLQSSLEKFVFVPKYRRAYVKDLEIQIRDVIYEAQDTIEFFVKQSEIEVVPEEQTISPSNFLHELQEIIEKIGLAKKEMEKISDLIRKETGDSLSEDAWYSKSTFGTKIKIVGQDKDRKLVIDELTSHTSQRQIIPIIGMPGIGKTILARCVYEHREIENHFNIRAWVTVSSDLNVRDIFLKLHSSMVTKGQKRDDSGSMKNLGEIVNQERADLALSIYQKLYNTRYLVVIDDMWDTRVWDELNNHFPDNKNGSRIILTTRYGDIADYIVNPSEFRRVMPPLGLEDSWTLLCIKAFEEGDSEAQCPPNLEKTGRRIAENCQGLPLSLTVVGGLLSQKRTEEYWKIVEDDTKAAAASSEEAYLEILSQSYENLPGRLKGCFLYMAAFPGDSEIPVSKLIKLWVAEGFLTPASAHKTLEQVAVRCLHELVGRNLILVRKTSSGGQIKTCGMYDILRDLAVQKSRKEKFFHAIDRYVRQHSEGTESQRRLSVHNNALIYTKHVYNSTKSFPLARTLLCVGPHHHHPVPFSLTFELLRVLDAYTLYFIVFPIEIIKLIHLRYLSFTYNGKLPSSISKLRNLQTLIVRRHPKIIFMGKSILPVEIWSMPQLRHLLFTESELPPIPFGGEIEAQNYALLQNLQSLSHVNATCCTQEVLQNIPNLKKLGIWIGTPGAVNFYFDVLEHLEAFKFTVLNPHAYTEIAFQPQLAFPKNLRKLSLRGCGIPWENMEVITKLPYLEVLKLRELAFRGEEWCLEKLMFQELKFLLLEYMDLKYWRADDLHFPSLKSLIIRHCYDLEEIPSEMGNIGGLELIELVDCSPSAVKSAEYIRDLCKELDVDLRVLIHSSWE